MSRLQNVKVEPTTDQGLGTFPSSCVGCETCPGKTQGRGNWELIPATAISIKDKPQTAQKAKLQEWRGDLLCAVPAVWVWCLCGFCSALLLCPNDFQVLVSQKCVGTLQRSAVISSCPKPTWGPCAWKETSPHAFQPFLFHPLKLL